MLSSKIPGLSEALDKLDPNRAAVRQAESFCTAQDALAAVARNQADAYGANGMLGTGLSTVLAQNPYPVQPNGILGTSSAPPGYRPATQAHMLEHTKIPEDVLRKPPFSMPLRVVYDIWQARMGDKWVQLQDLDKEEDAEFWRLALLRLFRAKLMEDVPLTISGQVAFRLLEQQP